MQRAPRRALREEIAAPLIFPEKSGSFQGLPWGDDNRVGVMMRAVLAAFIGLTLVGCGGGQPREDAAPAQSAAALVEQGDAWAEAVEGLERRDGFITVYVDEEDGRVLAAFPAPNEDGLSLRAIYAAGLTSGLGSNPIGLDRGLFDGGSLMAFRRVGGKLVAEKENWNYRASGDNPLERRAVRESFARSFVWAGEIAAESEAGDILVDLSSFLTRDALDVRGVLAGHPKGGSFNLAADRSFPDPGAVLAFPDNVEFDAFLTLTSDKPGEEVRATAADPRAVTLVQHHSLVRLPDDGFTPRPFDPRSGAIEVAFYDFAAPLADPVKRGYARRYRLNKVDRNAETSAAVEPIVFYIDPGAPEPVRSALIDGAVWWAEAFEAAGFTNAFRVEMLPEGAHPRDIRYNIIQWTHRQTRGWSYGGGVSDPRTGEMIKGSVILGSQRVRQDRMIFEGLAGAVVSGTGAANDPVEIALARIRQLSAHEVGHALGFAHNFAASSNNRASVMDYPAPDIRVLENGALDFSRAYGVGVGEWDKLAARWLYAEFFDGADERTELERILRDGYGTGLRFVGDREGRSVGTGHPHASVWDNGGDPVAALRETMAVRKAALDNFGPAVIKNGKPMAELRQVIVPIYLYHRYQVDAAAKLIGGFSFAYKAKGDTLPDAAPVNDAAQRLALAALLETLDPAALTLPAPLLDQLTPALGGFGALAGGAETFPGGTEPKFDLAAAAESASAITFDALLHPARAARLVEARRRDPSALGFAEMLTAIDAIVFRAPESPDEVEIVHVIQNRFVSELIALSLDKTASTAVRAAAEARLRAVADRLQPSFFNAAPAEARDHVAWLRARIRAHLERPAEAAAPAAPAPAVPQGPPIGGGFMETCWHCDPVPQ